MKQLRILHTFRAPLGGLFRHVIDLATEQANRGHAVGILCDSSTGGTRADDALARLAPLLTLGIRRVPMQRNPGFSDLRALGAVRTFAREVLPDVLHGHGSKGGVYARFLSGRMLGSDAVRAYTPHGGSFNYHPGSMLHRVYMHIESYLTRRTDVFLFESKFIAERYRTYVGETDRHVQIVVNGVSEAEFEPIERDHEQFDFIYLGELRPAKGIDVLLDAMALLSTRYGAEPSLLVVGSGPDEAALKARSAALGLCPRIRFQGPDNIRKVLALAKVMVVPSKAESLPYVILEAAAARQPLVSTDVGGIPEIFGPHSHRLIPSSNVDALAAAMHDALQKPADELAAEASALSTFVHTRFTLPLMVDGVLEGYRAAIAGRHKG